MDEVLSRTAATRRALIATLAAWGALPAAMAQDYPNKPITLIVPFTAGGPTDAQARALGLAVSKQLKQPVNIVNQTGAAGTLGPVAMARQAAPDGYTLAVTPGTVIRQPLLQKVNYDPLQDFTWIANLTAYTHGISVRADAPWKTLQELLAYAKAHPGKVSYGTAGAGGTAHIAMSRLAKAAGVELTSVPFKGGADVFTALLGGHIDIAAEAGYGAMVDSGKVRLLAIFNDVRWKGRPSVPTVKESGYDIVMAGSYGLAGPKGMDPKVVQVIEGAFRQAMDDPEFNRSLDLYDQPKIFMDSKAYTSWVAKTYADDKRFLKELNIKLD